MSEPIQIAQQRDKILLSSFFDMVRSVDGDFTVIGQLASASSDPESMTLLVKHLSRHPQGKKAFEHQFTVGTLDLEALKQLPENTLGHLYAEHMLRNQLKPLAAEPAKNAYQYLGMHITETHDIWHVVTGSDTDILGEIQLEAFYVAQLEVSRFWLALLAKNLLKSAVYDVEVATQYMDVLTKGWLMGRQAKPLFGIEWNTLWEQPLKHVRDSLGIVEL